MCGEEKFPSMAHIHVYERAVLSTATIKMLTATHIVCLGSTKSEVRILPTPAGVVAQLVERVKTHKASCLFYQNKYI